jgi:hypothetical protein
MADDTEEGAERPRAPGAQSPKNVVVIPPEAVQRAAEQGQPLTVVIESVTAHSGPLPPPALLQAYDGVYPGLSRIIVEQFQAEGRHRRRTQSISQLGALGARPDYPGW